MFRRRLESIVAARLTHSAAVVLLGPRQVGKTTLALQVAADRSSTYLDLEAPRDRDKLLNPEEYLRAHRDHLLILDEVQRVPDLFSVLRGLIDEGRREGTRAGRFLLLGSASRELLQQSESLAGRVVYLELAPFDVLELPIDRHPDLWVRGGFPESILADDAAKSLVWREAFIRTYLERDIPQLGPRIPAATLHRFWTMLAHGQGGVLNAANLARGLAVDGKTVARYLDLMVDLMLVRRLPPFVANVGKRLVRSPKVFVRDSGLVHALLGIPDRDTLLGHPVVGGSWEGFVLEHLVAAAPERAVPYFYRTSSGAEIDLLLDIPGQGLWAIDITRGVTAVPEKGFHVACADLRPARRFVVNAGADRYPIGDGIEAIGLVELAGILSAL